MVQIYIKVDDKSDVQEWAIIEVQGDLEVTEGENLNNKLLGDLHVNKDGSPVMVIGHHLIYGKCVSLDKPLVVMKKSTGRLNETVMETDEALDHTFAHKNTEYLIKAVIRKKYLFNKRPRPIVVLNESKK